MAKLYQRKWNVVVGTAIGALSAGLRVSDHRIAFTVEKTLKPEPNTCTLEIWNLSKTQRAGIEELAPKTGDTRGIPVLIEAGYEETGANQIFLGDLRTAYSRREGADWITTIESGDGEQAHQNARINVALGPGTRPDVALRAIVKALGIDQGNAPIAIAKLLATGSTTLAPKRFVMSGSATQHMTNFCKSAGLEWSIQDGAIQILDLNRTLAPTFAVRLASDTGLVDAPSIDPKGVLTCRMLMIPQVRVGALLVLDSATIRGAFKIERAKWQGDTYGTPWYIEVEAKRY